MEQDFLDEAFANTGAVEAEQAEAAPEPQEQPEPASDGPLRGPDGKFLPKQTTGVEPQDTADTVPPTDKLPKEDYKAIREEREKRKALQAELEALKQQFQSFQNPQEPPAPPPTIWEDEQGWQQHLQAQVLKQADQLSRINASEMAARAQHPDDFGEMFDLFNEMAAQNPSIVQQAMADPHPWGKAYQMAKAHRSMQELGAVDVSDLEAKIEARVREKLAAEQAAQPPVAIPTTLADHQSARGGHAPAAISGTPTIEDFLGRR